MSWWNSGVSFVAGQLAEMSSKNKDNFTDYYNSNTSTGSP
jgi:hypothetical protein